MSERSKKGEAERAKLKAQLLMEQERIKLDFEIERKRVEAQLQADKIDFI